MSARQLVGDESDRPAATQPAHLAPIADPPRQARTGVGRDAPGWPETVIRPLFAAGLRLHGLQTLEASDEVRRVARDAASMVDYAVKEVRAAALANEVAACQAGDGRLRGDIAEMVGRAISPAGWRPSLTLDGPLDAVTDPQGAAVLLAGLAEALSSLNRKVQPGITAVHVLAEPDPSPDRLIASVIGRDDNAAVTRYGLRTWSERFGAYLAVIGGRPSFDVTRRRACLRWTLPTSP